MNVDKVIKGIGKTAGIMPFIIMCFNLIGYAVFVYSFWAGYIPAWLETLYDLNRQMCDMSLFALFGLLCLHRFWRLISSVSYACLCLLWLINTVYILSNWEADLYFALIVTVIYAFFVIVTVRTLIVNANAAKV